MTKEVTVAPVDVHNGEREKKTIQAIQTQKWIISYRFAKKKISFKTCLLINKDYISDFNWRCIH